MLTAGDAGGRHTRNAGVEIVSDIADGERVVHRHGGRTPSDINEHAGIGRCVGWNRRQSENGDTSSQQMTRRAIHIRILLYSRTHTHGGESRNCKVNI